MIIFFLEFSQFLFNSLGHCFFFHSNFFLNETNTVLLVEKLLQCRMAETPHPANLTFHGHDGSVPLMSSNRPKAMTAMEGTYPQYSTVTTGAQPNIQGAPRPIFQHAPLLMADFDPIEKSTPDPTDQQCTPLTSWKDVPTFSGTSSKKHGLRVEDWARDMRYLLEVKGPQTRSSQVPGGSAAY